jgi:hypothetical protein
MSRFVLPARLLLTTALLGGLLVSPAPAQPLGEPAPVPLPGGWGIGSPDAPDLMDARELARAKYEALHADPRELARQRLVAARAASRGRHEEFLAGRYGSLDFVLDNARRLLEAELAVSDQPGEQVAVLERNWKRAAVGARIGEVRFLAGRVPLTDYAQLRYAFLGAEIAWLRARHGERADRTRGLPPWPFVSRTGDEEMPYLDEERELSQDKREALLADPADLARLRLEAAEDGYREAFAVFLAGGGRLHMLADWAARVLEAELAVREKPYEQLTAYEACWARTKQLDLVNEGVLASGRGAVSDYLELKYARLDVEIRWAEARARLGKSARWEAGIRASRLPVVFPQEDADADESPERRMARAKWEALRADAHDLARERLAAARGAYRERWQEFLAARGTQDILFNDSERWLTSELALYTAPAERAAAWERQWTRLRLVEAIDEGRVNAGRLTIDDWMKSRCLRLDAEIHWAEARAALDRK